MVVADPSGPVPAAREPVLELEPHRVIDRQPRLRRTRAMQQRRLSQTTFEAPDGTTASSDGWIPDQSASTMDGWLDQDDAATNLSWYDAMQFAIWTGGCLPTRAELRAADGANGAEIEWTSDWFSEEQSLIAVWSPASRETRGFNPDFRSHRIGFRIVLPFIDP